MAQDLWLLKDARKSVKAKKAAFGPLHIATTGTEVAGSASRKSSMLSAVMLLSAVMEIECCTCAFVLLNDLSHMIPY